MMGLMIPKMMRMKMRMKMKMKTMRTGKRKRTNNENYQSAPVFLSNKITKKGALTARGTL